MGDELLKTTFGPGERGEPVVARSGVPVWTIAGYLKLFGWDTDKVVEEFDGVLTRDEVGAAREYYKEHDKEIDQKLLVNQWVA